jgi:hypothetical protein
VVRRDPLGALRSGDRQLEIQQAHLLTLSAASTHGDQFIRAAEINLLDDYGLAGRYQMKRQILPAQSGSGRLLGFAVITITSSISASNRRELRAMSESTFPRQSGAEAQADRGAGGGGD